jgi:hypothetical protein
MRRHRPTTLAVEIKGDDFLRAPVGEPKTVIVTCDFEPGLETVHQSVLFRPDDSFDVF